MIDQLALEANSAQQQTSQCRLCSSPTLKVIFRIQHEQQDYTVASCEQCDVLQTLEHYDAVSPDYADLQSEDIDDDRLWCQNQHKLPAFREWSEQLQALRPDGHADTALLDIGCGTGGFLKFVATTGMDVYGFDSSAAQAEHARKELPNVRQACSIPDYLSALSQADLRFDVVTLWDVLEHIRTPMDLLESIFDVLKPNGLLFVSVPNGKAMLWKRRVYSLFGNNHEATWLPWEHVFYYSPHSLAHALQQTGFVVEKLTSVACYPRPLSGFEVLRRIAFMATNRFPSMAPQICAWGRNPTT